MTEQNPIAFKGAHYLDIVEYLLRHEADFKSNSALRSAVSRAYYAAFLTAREYACQKLHYTPAYDASDHFGVMNHFRKTRFGSFIPSCLKDLHDWRNMCDYDNVLKNSTIMKIDAIKKANRIIDALK